MPADEFSLIERYFSHLGQGAAVDLAVGDDCAILQLQAGERLATSVDTLLAGVHFPESAAPDHIACRAVAVAASDLAAMGARPLGMTLALTLPEADEDWLQDFSRGLAGAVAACRLPLVGGDTTRGALAVTVQVMGALPLAQALLRSGASVGDVVYVSGFLGDGAGALAVLEGRWRPEPEHTEYLLDRFYRPRARLDLGRELLGRASAAIDISDGLLADAGHIATASGVRIQFSPEHLPVSPALQTHECQDTVLLWALTGGDDYELCFCLDVDAEPPADCTRIGCVEAGKGVGWGSEIDIPRGYQHFS